MTDYPELTPVIVYRDGVLQFEGFLCPICAVGQSWACDDVRERWVLTVCRACRTVCKLSKRVLHELVRESDCILPSGVDF